MKSFVKTPVSLGTVAILATVITLAGCSKSPEADQPATSAPQQTATASEAPGMTTPLTQEQVGARYAIVSDPVVANNGELIRTVVSVTNAGKETLSSKGTLPVNLAISLVDSSGAVSAKDFVRAPLPADGIPAGASAEVIAEVPAQAVVGKSLRFGLVQEGVAWFSDFKIEPLDYGPFTSCADQGKQTICGAGGKPLSTR
ncbi:glycosyltransferase [Xanthomonas campestris pv. asclepiadis]|uniref:glycosyltransferase n=1 Tax=Xanthomonas campestris TaxID=339 RepID=UPI001E3A8F65|nr:glycosyltransferase [Xanthomonas campestris]MCC4614629.1 glycosyltransferase [Xanthomonas campestris pv. asclepiadis]